MGGLFKEVNQTIFFENREYKYEYNIVSDIPSSQNFIQKVPVKTVFVDFLCGNEIHTGRPLLERKMNDNPMSNAFKIFQGDKPRESWDSLAMMYAVFGKEDMFSISSNGTISIDDDGNTVFDDKKSSNHYYVRLKNNKEYYENKIDNIIKGGLKDEKDN